MNPLIAMGLLSASGILLSCQRPQPADLIIVNARIYTVDSSFSIQSGLVVIGDTFAAVGPDRDLVKKYTSEQIVDLGGRSVYPGFHDAHCHFAGYADFLRKADLRDCRDFAEVCDRLLEHQERIPSTWVLGRGWDQNDWPGRKFPDRSRLDSLFPDKPVYLTRIDGHAAVVNTRALEMAGITERTTVTGGQIMREKGRLTGTLIDNAMDLVSRLIPDATPEELEQGLQKAQANCLAVGLTTVSDAGLDGSTVRLMERLHQEGKLKMRINAVLSPTRDNLENMVSKGPYRTERLTVRAVKLYADGALGSYGALLLEPYSDASEMSGLQVSTADYLKGICQTCYDHGYQVQTHCIGDSANRLMLNLYKDILQTKNDRRWRIEHAQIIHPDDFHLFGDYTIIPSIQTTHATSDMSWADSRVGPVRIKSGYAYKQLLEQNGWLPNGSDFPIEDINPLYGFFSGFARTDHQGHPEGGWQMENALTREECLKAMTVWAARSYFEEHDRGSIEPGKKADFVVLEKDIMTAEPLQVPGIKVLQTWISGEKVFDRE